MQKYFSTLYFIWKNKTYLSDGVLGCDNFSWLLHPIYGCLNELRSTFGAPPFVCGADPDDIILEFGVPPRENDPLWDTLGDVCVEFRCDVDHRVKPVWPWWLWDEGLSITGLLRSALRLCPPSELSDVVFELSPAHRWLPVSELRFRVKLPGVYEFPEPVVCLTPDVYCLYQSGMLRRCREAWTRSWCSLSAALFSCSFCSSFSGGC